MRRIRWQIATLFESRKETHTAWTLVFQVPDWPGHLPGQHVDVRLTAPDGYSTQRSYSLAAPANGDQIQLTVQRVPDGEVSPYLTEELKAGDQIEVRGPVGGWFVWRPQSSAPVLLVAGGSGVVPLMAMLRARERGGSRAPFRLVYSVREPAERFYVPELHDPAPRVDVSFLYTRTVPDGWARPPSRLSDADLADVSWSGGSDPECFVCGPTGFVESVAEILLSLGHDAHRIKTERFGPTGG
jgi:ferredoxin-NADP reductase